MGGGSVCTQTCWVPHLASSRVHKQWGLPRPSGVRPPLSCPVPRTPAFAAQCAAAALAECCSLCPSDLHRWGTRTIDCMNIGLNFPLTAFNSINTPMQQRERENGGSDRATQAMQNDFHGAVKSFGRQTTYRKSGTQQRSDLAALPPSARPCLISATPAAASLHCHPMQTFRFGTPKLTPN